MNLDRFRKSDRLSLSRFDSRRGVWIILVLLFAVLLMVTTVLAFDGSEAVANPDAPGNFDSAEALSQVRGILSVKSLNPSGCIYEASGYDGCTANDVTLGNATNLVILNGCNGVPGDTASFLITYEITTTATTKYDAGIYFAIDGDPPIGVNPPDGAISGVCQVDILPPGPIDGSQSPPNYYFDADGDACGDLTSANNVIHEFSLSNVSCVDDDGDGYLNLPYCTSWNVKPNYTCNSEVDAYPSSEPKCNCDPGFNVEIPVPPVLEIDKSAPLTAYGPNDQFSYTIVFGNTDPGQPVTNVVVTDQLDPDLRLDSIVPPAGGTCTPTTFPGNYGELVTCTVPGPMNPGDSDQFTITVTVNPDAYIVQIIPNEACVNADGTRPPGSPIDPVPVCDSHDVTTPVTVSYFEASVNGDGTRFEWATGSETGNAGFNIYVETEAGRQKVNDSLILSSVVDSLDAQEYSFEVSGLQGESFYIEDVSILGQNRLQGPFAAGKAHGQKVNREAIDWTAVQLENETLAAERASVARAALTPVNSAVQPANLVQRVVTWTGNLINVALGRPVASVQTAAAAYPAVDLRVNQDGIYRVTYEQLLATTGANLAGANAADLALSTANGSVPIYVAGGDTFGPGSYLEFYGQGLDTLYTDTNVYKLEVNAAFARRIVEDQTRTDRKVRPAAYYMETVAVENNDKYGYIATNGDPWYDRLLYTVSGLEFSRQLLVDNYVNAAPSVLKAEMWGITELADHHVQLALNGQPVADAYFSAQSVKNVSEQVPAGNVHEGVNTLTFTVPNDLGAEYDMSALEMYSLTYPRAFVARNGKLDFAGAADAFRVTDLNSNDVVAYRVVGNTPTRLGSIKIGSSAASAYMATFAGSQRQAAYYVSTAAALTAPEMALSRATATITSGSADLLIIAHPNFISGLAPLVSARQTQGLAVKVVNVEDVYAQFSGGVFDAQAIKDYINYALRNMGVQYVLLAGGDTRDYRDYSGAGSISFIPSLYAETSPIVYFAPVDPLYTDVDGDGVPNAAIGRFPVRTVNQLTALVNKTLLYDARTERDTAVFAADVRYENDSEAFVPAGWTVDKAYVGPDGLATARTTLIDSMNSGPALASFVGHSDTDVWTFDPLFSTVDAAALTNLGKPMVVTQWGCFNTYYVGGAFMSLGDNFLLRPNIGAAAVTGATTITNANSERELGKLMMPKLVQNGVSIGEAMQEAKVELAAKHPDMVDVLLGWTILGDPTLVVVQPQS